MNTIMILCATVLSSISAQNADTTPEVVKPVQVDALEIKGDITLMTGYERYLTDPGMDFRPRRDA